jgi:hypothetical protein
MAMYSGRATDATKVATFRKTLAAFAINIGVFCMCTVAFLVGATELVILTTCPRSRDEIGSGPWTKKRVQVFCQIRSHLLCFKHLLVCSYCSLLVFVFFVLVFFTAKTW